MNTCKPLIPYSAEHTAFKAAIREAGERMARLRENPDNRLAVKVETTYLHDGTRVYTRVPTSDYTIHGVPVAPGVPVVPNLDERILECVARERAGGRKGLKMATWHDGTAGIDTGCGTAHCLAGWAVHLAGAEGYALEHVSDAEVAGAAIFLTSVGYVPDFMAMEDDYRALNQLRAHVAARRGTTVENVERDIAERVAAKKVEPTE